MAKGKQGKRKKKQNINQSYREIKENGFIAESDGGSTSINNGEKI